MHTAPAQNVSAEFAKNSSTIFDVKLKPAKTKNLAAFALQACFATA
jgi:hypothetical protein